MSFYSLQVYCADIGTMRNGKGENKFGWASARITPNKDKPQWSKGQDMRDLVRHVAEDLRQGSKVAVGFECPLWIPVRDDPEELTLGRLGDGGRAWSARAGSGSLTTGLAQIAWMLQAIRRGTPSTKAFLNWDAYKRTDSGLFIWEAFVSGKKKGTSHTEDAKIAVTAFIKALPSPGTSVTLPPESQPRSLIGAALLWSGWSVDQDLLRQSCMVIKA